MPAAAEDTTTNRRSSGDNTPRLKIAAKAVGQVMAALKNSKKAAGPTMTEIVKFISGALFKPATKRQVCIWNLDVKRNIHIYLERGLPRFLSENIPFVYTHRANIYPLMTPRNLLCSLFSLLSNWSRERESSNYRLTRTLLTVCKY